MDGSGNVYVAEGGGHTIRKVGADGQVTTVAGSGIPGNSDGTGTAASFNFPAGVALDGSGNLYVADRENNNIRKITLQGGSPRPISSAVLDLSVRPDDTTALLRFDAGTGQMSLDTLDNAGSVTSGRSLGPYVGWTPRATATGLDGLTRVLWNNEDGSAALWLTGPDGNEASFRLGPVSGATAMDVAAAAAGMTHILWTYADGGIAVWSVDNCGPCLHRTSLRTLSGLDRRRDRGRPGRTLSNPLERGRRFGRSLVSGAKASSPALDWVPVWAAHGLDRGRCRRRRRRTDPRSGDEPLLRQDGCLERGQRGNPSNQGPIYCAPPGFTARRITAGSDGLTRVLWTSAGDGALVWILSADNAYQESFYLDSVPTSNSWDVTIRVADVTGPDFCIWTPSVGTAFGGTYELVRSGSSVSFIPLSIRSTGRRSRPRWTARTSPPQPALDRDETCALTIRKPPLSGKLLDGRQPLHRHSDRLVHSRFGAGENHHIRLVWKSPMTTWTGAPTGSHLEVFTLGRCALRACPLRHQHNSALDCNKSGRRRVVSYKKEEGSCERDSSPLRLRQSLLFHWRSRCTPQTRSASSRTDPGSSSTP